MTKGASSNEEPLGNKGASSNEEPLGNKGRPWDNPLYLWIK
ncbi:hypothetical protein R4482_09715 [Acinetobacter baumannii]|nr:hypothetical protein [Acinetobacter baumannii]